MLYLCLRLGFVRAFFMPFLRGGGLGGEPDQGHYGGDWRRYYQAADRLERGQYGDSQYPVPAAGCGEAAET